MNLALKDIAHTKLRFVLTTAGVALLLTGASGMGGLYRGVVTDALQQINLLETDLWVVEAGTYGPYAEPSRVSFEVRDRVAGLPGAEQVRVFFRTTAVVDGVNTDVIGLDWPTDRGEWLDMARGRFLGAGRGEAIVDESLGYRVGDEVLLGREGYRVVGTADRFLNSMGDGMVVVGLQDAVDIASERPVEELMAERITSALTSAPGTRSEAGLQGGAQTATAVLLDVAPGADPSALTQTIERWGDVSVVPHSAQESYMLEGQLGRLRTQILTFTSLLLVITAVVVTLIVYMLTMEKLHQIAMLKLLGARDRMIIGMIVQQALAIGVAAWIAAQFLGDFFFGLMPREVVLLPLDRALYGVALLFICLAASGLGISKALKVEAQEILA